MRFCSEAGCEGLHRARGLCNKHYIQKHRPGYRKQHYRLNKEKTNKQNTEWYRKNKEALKPTRQWYYQRAKGEFAKRTALWRGMNPGAILATEDLSEINSFYVNCPKGMEIDHILPIKSKYICGLHTLANLQYLTPEENNWKRSSFDFTYDNRSWMLRKRPKNGTQKKNTRPR